MRSLPSKDARAYLQDILKSIHSIETFVLQMSFEDFRDDEKTVSAVERKLLVISEAATRLGVAAENSVRRFPGAIFAVSAIGFATNTAMLTREECGRWLSRTCHR